ncbi:MAG TPA: cupin domain-containing protein [Vitreimonas sp.]|nr:cupin domain-containing protein [Vitreimonas sp.]
MHVTPVDFRAVRRDGVLLNLALLDGIAFAIAEFPGSGSRGTFVEAPCEDPHWAMVLRGDIELELEGQRHQIAPGTAFHVPGGIQHRILAPGPARLAGFDRVRPDAPTTDAALRRAGFEVLKSAPRSANTGVAVQRARPQRPPAEGDIIATSRRMGELLFTRIRLGRRSGYTSSPCDVPHWGIVTSGSLAIESEDDIEILAAGDVYYCPPGPPGHRLQAAEPAIVADFTPIAALQAASRVVHWRREPAEAALKEPDSAPQLELAAL